MNRIRHRKQNPADGRHLHRIRAASRAVCHPYQPWLCAVAFSDDDEHGGKRPYRPVLGNLTSALVGVMALVGGATSQVLAVLLSGMAGSTACAKLATCKAARILGCGLVAGAAGGAVYICMGFDGQRIFDILQSVLVSMAVALVASMVCWAHLTWEQGLRFNTDEAHGACNPPTPCCTVFDGGPGTYHHSIMVGNLAEGGCRGGGGGPAAGRARRPTTTMSAS
ncbi:MAG: hypothetical protein ACLUVV_07040 [Christensenellales bacterium]